MKCPVCSQEMVEQDFGGAKIDVCRDGCKGMWFDWGELVKLDENNEGLGKALKEALQYSRTNDENRPKVKCPKCGIPMQVHKYSRAQEVNVDECYACGGFFLDSGELKAIRDTFMSDEEVNAYVDKLVKGMPEFQQAKSDLAKQKTRNDAIGKYTKFLRISYWAGK